MATFKNNKVKMWQENRDAVNVVLGVGSLIGDNKYINGNIVNANMGIVQTVTGSGTGQLHPPRLSKLSIVQIVLGIKPFYIYYSDKRY